MRFPLSAATPTTTPNPLLSTGAAVPFPAGGLDESETYACLATTPNSLASYRTLLNWLREMARKPGAPMRAGFPPGVGTMIAAKATAMTAIACEIDIDGFGPHDARRALETIANLSAEIAALAVAAGGLAPEQQKEAA